MAKTHARPQSRQRVTRAQIADLAKAVREMRDERRVATEDE